MERGGRTLGILGLAALASLGAAQSWNFQKINPKATYLRDSQSAPTASMLDLETDPTFILLRAQSGATPTLEIRTVGWFNRALDNPAAHNVSDEAVAVFAQTSSLDSDWTHQFRVFTPIEAGTDFITLPTWAGNQPTDISEDFGVNSSTLAITIPGQARFVMLTPFDNGFWNNGDDFSMPNADSRGFGVEWRVYNAVPEPGSVFLLSIGIAAAVRRKLKR